MAAAKDYRAPSAKRARRDGREPEVCRAFRTWREAGPAIPGGPEAPRGRLGDPTTETPPRRLLFPPSCCSEVVRTHLYAKNEHLNHIYNYNQLYVLGGLDAFLL